MIQNVLRTLGGIERYGIVSLCLFFAIFVVMLVWAFSLRKPHLNRMAELPLEPEPQIPNSQDKDSQ
jgi:hypothetical protein